MNESSINKKTKDGPELYLHVAVLFDPLNLEGQLLLGPLHFILGLLGSREHPHRVGTLPTSLTSSASSLPPC